MPLKTEANKTSETEKIEENHFQETAAEAENWKKKNFAIYLSEKNILLVQPATAIYFWHSVVRKISGDGNLSILDGSR